MAVIGDRFEVRDKGTFVRRMMTELAGDGASMSLEGALSNCRFAANLVITRDEMAVLKRNTLWPRQDFVAVRLRPETIDSIFKQVMAAGWKRIIHVQIERSGVLELGAYDNFQCVSIGPGVSAALFDELKNAKVLRDLKVAAPRSKP